jgi:hypothetical protein
LESGSPRADNRVFRRTETIDYQQRTEVPSRTRATIRQRAFRTPGILIGALLCLVPLTLFACAGCGQTLTTEAVVGSWSSRYLEGRVDLRLMADGTYYERLYGFRSRDGGELAEEDYEGTWSIEGDRVVLVDFLGVRWTNLGDDGDFYSNYGLVGTLALEPLWKLFADSAYVLQTVEMVRFTRLDD